MPVPDHHFRLSCFVQVALAACERPDHPPDDRGDVTSIAIHPHVTIRTDTVGHDRWERRATFVLVDADNRGEQPLLVTLGGVLVDGDGREVGRVRAETLTIPAGGRRTFALIDDQQVPRPTAVGANLDVRGARRPHGADPITIAQGHVWDDHGKVVATGMVVNRSERSCVAIVLAGFHGPDGVPLTRPFAVFELGGHAEKPTRFVGPEGSTAGYIFIGDIRC
jgi:hypothetical protein